MRAAFHGVQDICEDRGGRQRNAEIVATCDYTDSPTHVELLCALSLGQTPQTVCIVKAQYSTRCCGMIWKHLTNLVVRFETSNPGNVRKCYCRSLSIAIHQPLRRRSWRQ
ncbi:uncharacterized protein LAJ45_10141 [Morchella importuna]|uniref:uncharacterized protein n=1 Tax=Morchella importuna TaxID=1174673 RepID=UPI001E8D25A8|nr:uncharacterized protein LAJ45_10141 [Morchella importuna]KAH8145818.1 hypothetical protein LAJ45_10141 [Morchella importuna]